MTSKQTLNLHIGQAGIQMGSAIWELISLEHGIKVDGRIDSQYMEYGVDNEIQSFFYPSEHRCRRYAPRCVFVDTESMVIDEVRTGSYKYFFPSFALISGVEDGANLYPRGYCMSCKNIRTPTLEAIRLISETSDSLHGFMIFRSSGGGTGSGGTTLFLHEIENEYSKLNVLEITIITAPCISISVVEPYNTVLALSKTMSHINLSMILDNQALYDIFNANVNIGNPSYFDINQILAQTVSSLTASLRFESVLSYDFNIYQTNFMPIPQLKYSIVSYAPINSPVKECIESYSINNLTKKVFQRKYFMLKCFPEFGEHISCAILYRGKNCKPNEILRATCKIRPKLFNRFVDWYPTGLKIGITRQPIPYIQYSCLGKAKRSVCLLTNSTCISQVFDYIIQKFDILYKSKAYVHWFTGEGLEESEFEESREGVLQMIMNYMECTQDSKNNL